MVSNQRLGFIAKARKRAEILCFHATGNCFIIQSHTKNMFSVSDLEMPDFFPFPTLQNELVKVVWKTLKQSQGNQGKPSTKVSLQV